MTQTKGRYVRAALLCVCFSCAFPTVLLGQDLQHYRPAIGGGGNYFATHGAKVGPIGRLLTSAQINYASNPLVRRDAEGRIIDAIVSDLTTAEFMASWALSRRFELGVALPVSHATKPSELDLDDGSGLGELRVAPKLIIMGAKRKSGLGVATVVPLHFPTATEEYEFSARHFSARPTLAAEFRSRRWRLAGNLGYRWLPTRPESLKPLALDSGAIWSFGMGFKPYPRRFELVIDVFGARFRDAERGQMGPAPAEVLAGFRVFGRDQLVFSMGAGGGLNDDFSSPEFRVLGGLTWSMDSARSGGVAYADQFSDQDDDGVKDSADRCPESPEDLDGFRDADGCPDRDNDQDGVADAEDRCPLHPEDVDGFRDADGCPDPDNDGDGVADVEDRCPLHPENKNGVADQDGCPDDERIVVGPDRIRHLDKIFFETGKSTIQPQSYPILDRIAVAIVRRPNLRLVRIEGHTDAFGGDAFNRKLAQARAEAVMDYLVQSGVEASRLEAVGFGKEKIVGDGRSAISARLSRRVEFVIKRRN